MNIDRNDQGARSPRGAYVLDAVDSEEREQVEQLVLEDQASRAELHALQLGAAWLRRADGRPAARVWDAIRSELELGPGEPEAAMPVVVTSIDRRRVRPA